MPDHPNRPTFSDDVRARHPTGVAWQIVVLAVAIFIGASGSAVSADGDRACWRPPVDGDVVDPFREPPCQWCAGNRGIEYGVAADVSVRAVASGVVTFSGMVVGIRYVVAEVRPGWRVTYGMLTETSLHAGDTVVRGAAIGRATGRVFFGLRIGGAYVDPAPLLGEWAWRRRLVPLDGTERRAVAAPTLRCRVVPGAR